jgi:hypothetical protein
MECAVKEKEEDREGEGRAGFRRGANIYDIRMLCRKGTQAQVLLLLTCSPAPKRGFLLLRNS